MTRYEEIQAGFDKDGDLDRDEIRWLLKVAKAAGELVSESCLCSQTQRDIRPLKLAMVCNCGVCRDCYRMEEARLEAQEMMREYRIAKDGE